jgi:glucokinase
MSIQGGIDLGGTKIQAAIVDQDHRAIGTARHPTPTSGGPEDVAREMEAALREAARAAQVEVGQLAGVGVGSPGTIEGQSVREARNLPGWQGSFALGERLSAALGCDVRLGNDVEVATNAEFLLGAGREYRSLLGVFWGTGVGGGLILDGRPWRGRGGAGEIGHVVVEIDGARCGCGRRGCMEAYAGRAAMERQARKLHEQKGRKTDLFKLAEHHGRERLTSGIWARALAHEDALARQLIERAVRALGAGVASVVNVLDLEAVIVGGGLGVRLGQPYAQRIADAMRPHLFIDARPRRSDRRSAAGGRARSAIAAGRLIYSPATVTITSPIESAEKTAAVTPVARSSSPRVRCSPIRCAERASRQMKHRLIGSSSPFTTCTPTSSEITGTPGIIATSALMAIMAVMRLTNTGASARRRPMPFS